MLRLHSALYEDGIMDYWYNGLPRMPRSDAAVAHLPGVATMQSGLLASAVNWSSIESPPTMRQKRSGGLIRVD